MRRCDWVASFSCKGAEEAAVVARHREPRVRTLLPSALAEGKEHA